LLRSRLSTLVLKAAEEDADASLEVEPGWKAAPVDTRVEEGTLLAAEPPAGEMFRVVPWEDVELAAAETSPPALVLLLIVAGGAGASQESIDARTELDMGVPITMPAGGPVEAET
jgi:hypothetical protein